MILDTIKNSLLNDQNFCLVNGRDCREKQFLLNRMIPNCCDFLININQMFSNTERSFWRCILSWNRFQPLPWIAENNSFLPLPQIFVICFYHVLHFHHVMQPTRNTLMDHKLIYYLLNLSHPLQLSWPSSGMPL